MLFLVIDATYLCHRNYYSTGGGSGVTEGLDNAVVFGLLRDIVYLQETFQARGMVFCFDEGVSLRRKLLPTYKAHRNGGRLGSMWTMDYDRRKKEFQRQILQLKEEVLPNLGLTNIFSMNGYEADDFIASACLNTRHRCVIVGSDKDFYQLLSDRVSMWKPKEKVLYTQEKFTEQYKVRPEEWSLVKAIAGCVTDNIPGIPGVKDITACKYVRKELGEKTIACKNIALYWATVLRNLPLVKLPFEGTPVVNTRKDTISQPRWRKVMEEYGMKSLVCKCPSFC